MKLKQFLILIACAAGLIVLVTVFRAAWITFTPPIASVNCTPQDLYVSSALQGATGSLGGQVSLTNVSSSSCYLLAPGFSLAPCPIPAARLLV